jgi:hypothetical protein
MYLFFNSLKLVKCTDIISWWSFNSLDCSEYTFEVKLFAPGSKEVGKLSNIRLPPLADIPGYVPPPLTSVMSITFNPQGE